MARYEFMKGLPVITMAEGKQVGKVDDLVVDPETKAVRWLRIHRGGCWAENGFGYRSTRCTGWVKMPSQSMRKPTCRLLPTRPKPVLWLRAKRRVIGNKVITENGERLGEVRDYEFAPDTFVLTSLSVLEGMNVVGPSLTIPADRVITIGEDMIVVAAVAAAGSEEQADAAREVATTPTQEKTA
jgi:sporulation protein YlmC with PRC-barrel domain